MKDYQIVVRWSEQDRCYLAAAPALAGCITHGETPEEALKNGRDAAALWIEDAVRNGDVIPKPARQMSGKLTLRMPRSLHESVAEAAERDGVSINQWIVTKLANSV